LILLFFYLIVLKYILKSKRDFKKLNYSFPSCKTFFYNSHYNVIMPYERMTRNLNQSIFSFIIGAAFSAILIAFFSMDALILAIFEVPLAFLVALIAVTECVYSYRDEVSLDTTIKMLRSLLKSLLISIPVVLLYSAIILILHQTIQIFEDALDPLFSIRIQGMSEIAAIPLLCYIPIFIMLFALPFLLYVYGKVHIILWGKPKEKKEKLRETLAEEKEKEFREKVFRMIDKLEQDAIRLQQYFLELQGVTPLIDSVNNHESYKTLNLRLNMMNDYVKSLEIEDTKENKGILKDEEVERKIRELDIQKKTIIDVLQQNMKKLKSEKGKFEKEEGEEEIEEEAEEAEEEVEEIVEETVEEKVEEEKIEETEATVIEEKTEDTINEEKSEES
jgi:hypothetical protein